MKDIVLKQEDLQLVKVNKDQISMFLNDVFIVHLFELSRATKIRQGSRGLETVLRFKDSTEFLEYIKKHGLLCKIPDKFE